MRRRISNNVNYSVVSPATGGSSRVGLTDPDLKAKLRQADGIYFSGVEGVTQQEYVSGGVEDDTVLDRVYSVGSEVITQTSATATANFDTVPEVDLDVTWSINDPSLATISASNTSCTASYLKDGVVELVAESRKYGISDAFRYDSYQDASGSEYRIFKEFATGSLCRDSNDTIGTLLSGLSPSASNMQIWSTVPSNSNYDAWTDVYYTGITFNDGIKGGVDEWVRNTGSWAASLDLTCVSPGRKPSGSSTVNRQQTATLISPYHYLTINHASYYPKDGDEIIFVDNDNNVESGIVLGSVPVADTDLRVGILDSAISAAITPAKVLKHDDIISTCSTQDDISQTFFVGIGYGAYGIRVSQHDLAIPITFTRLTRPGDPPYKWAATFTGDWIDWYVYIYPGDSGQPLFIVLDGQVSLIGPHTGVWDGYTPGGYINEIQSTMDLLSSTYELSPQTLGVTDTSGYLNFA